MSVYNWILNKVNSDQLFNSYKIPKIEKNTNQSHKGAYANDQLIRLLLKIIQRIISH